MAKFSIRTSGIRELQKTLGELKSNKALKPAMDEAVSHLKGDMRKYPRKARGSAYKRTGMLGRSWQSTVSKSNTALIGKVRTEAKHAPYVQGKGTQTAIHEDNWATMDEVLERETPAIRAIFKKHIKRLVEIFNKAR